MIRLDPYPMMTPPWVISVLALIGGMASIYILVKVRDFLLLGVMYRAGSVTLAVNQIFFAVIYFWYSTHEVDLVIRQIWVRAGLAFFFFLIDLWLISTIIFYHWRRSNDG